LRSKASSVTLVIPNFTVARSEYLVYTGCMEWGYAGYSCR
jgi:hypothetical protein